MAAAKELMDMIRHRAIVRLEDCMSKAAQGGRDLANLPANLLSDVAAPSGGADRAVEHWTGRRPSESLDGN